MTSIADPAAEQRPRSLADVLIARHLSTLQTDLDPLLRGERLRDVDPSRRDVLVSLFYCSLSDSYIGTDSHLPSKFFSAYPVVLERLGGEGRPRDCRVARIMTVDRDRLNDDARQNPQVWESYISIHKHLNIRLLQVDEEEARAALRSCTQSEGWTTDLGMWTHTCALLFEEPTLQNTRAVQLLVPGGSLWDSYHNYVSALFSAVRSVQLLSNGTLEFRAASPTLLQELEEIVQPNPPAQFEPKAPDQYGTLTEREKQVLALLGFGLSNKEIATRLSAADGTVSAKTIANYIYNISWKTGIRGRGKLIALARFRSP